jgi:hypothetical protein
MSTEKDILLNIHKITDQFLIQMDEAKIHIDNIKRDVTNLDNNYFEEDRDKIYSTLLTIFDELSLEELTQFLSNYKNIVEDKINNICVHEWIYDDIDIGPESSQRICYCKLCEITKK